MVHDIPPGNKDKLDHKYLQDPNAHYSANTK